MCELSVDVKQFKNRYLDLSYADQSYSQKLDLFLPEDQKGPFPLIVFIHGGAWISGNKLMNAASSVFKAVSQGYAVATVEYRLATEATWPSQIYDVKAAVRYLKAKASSFNIDPNRVVAWGNSAGAHLAQLLGVTENIKRLENLDMGNEEFSSSVNAVISLYGVSDLLALDEQASIVEGKPINKHSASMDNPPCKLMGFRILEYPEKTKLASPIEYITKDIPPFFIQHGTGDTVVPYLQSVELYNKIIAECGERKGFLELVEGAIHGDQVFKKNENINKCLDFLDKYLLGLEKRQIRELPEIKLI